MREREWKEIYMQWDEFSDTVHVHAMYVRIKMTHQARSSISKGHVETSDFRSDLGLDRAQYHAGQIARARRRNVVFVNPIRTKPLCHHFSECQAVNCCVAYRASCESVRRSSGQSYAQRNV